MYQGIEYLRALLIAKQERVNLRYGYYEMKNLVRDFNITIPPKWNFMRTSLAWSEKAVNSVSDRLRFMEFSDDNFRMNEIFNMNSKDVLVKSSIVGACIASCCFVYISPDENWYPRLQTIDAYDATGIMDPSTRLLEEGYAVLERDSKTHKPAIEAYFTRESTTFYNLVDGTVQVMDNPAPYPLLVPIVYRPDARRPFGHSRISRACMDIQQAALRVMKRAEVTAEFYSFPQKYVTGLSPDNEMMEKWQASISSMLQFTKDEDGDHPVLGQFTTQSVGPHMDQMKMLAGQFAAAADLTIDDLGFPSDNPSSAESIKATHERLRLACRNAQNDFETGLINVGYLAACVRDGFPYKRNEVYKTRVRWEPLFEPDASQLSGIGDAAIKIQQSFPDYFTEDKLHDLTGI